MSATVPPCRQLLEPLHQPPLRREEPDRAQESRLRDREERASQQAAHHRDDRDVGAGLRRGRREGGHERGHADRREHAAEHEERHTERIPPRGTEQPRGRRHQQHGAHESDHEARERLPADHRARGDRRDEQPGERALVALLEQPANAELHREEQEEHRHADREERGLRRHSVLGGGGADLGAPAAPPAPGRRARASTGAARPGDRRDGEPDRVEVRGERPARSTRRRATRSGRRATRSPRSRRPGPPAPVGEPLREHDGRVDLAVFGEPFAVGHRARLAKRHEVEALEQIGERVGELRSRVAVRRPRRSPRTLRSRRHRA